MWCTRMNALKILELDLLQVAKNRYIEGILLPLFLFKVTCNFSNALKGLVVFLAF